MFKDQQTLATFLFLSADRTLFKEKDEYTEHEKGRINRNASQLSSFLNNYASNFQLKLLHAGSGKNS